ncbi:MAG: hypothetical protein ACQESR_30950 [Planctomycetota bacterium]
MSELRRDWATWTDHEKADFSQSFVHYQGRRRCQILRFLMRNGNHSVWSAIAASVASSLPINESLPFLRECCKSSETGCSANYYQALWLTGSPEAVGVLWTALDRIWASPDLMTPDSFCNFTAFDAIWCIDALIRLGDPLDSLRDPYEKLKMHPTMRGDAVRWLSEHFEHEDS